MRTKVMLASLAVWMAVAHPAAADPRERAAKAHYQKGARLFTAKRYAQALVEYRAAYELSPRPPLLFNMARALHENGDKAEALAHYRRYLDAVPPKGPVADEAREFAAALERELGPAPTPTPTPPPPAPRPAPTPEPAPPAPVAVAPVAEPPAPRPPPSVESTPTVEAVAERPTRRAWRLGARAGLSVSTLNDSEWHGSARLGVAAGGFVGYAVSPWLAARLDLAFVQKGTNKDQSYFQVWHMDYLESAIVGEVSVWRVKLWLGPYLGLRVARDTPFNEELKARDFGAVAGAGIAYPLGPGNVTLDVSYEHGLLTAKSTASVYNRAFLITLGYSQR